MHPMGVFTVSLLFGGLTLVGIAAGPIGRAIADRLRGGHLSRDAERELADVQEEVAKLREQVSEQAERLDFAERLLAQAREKGLLSPPKS